jgi:hypothetical protein
MKRDEFEARIVKKAWEDPPYRQRLLANPRAVVSEELAKIKEGVSVPANVKVTVLEEKVDQIYLVIPVNPREVTGKLGDKELQGVAGGTGGPPNIAMQLDVVQVIQVVVQVAVGLDVVQAIAETVVIG